MTDKEYIKLYKKCPFVSDYEGNEADKEAIIAYNKSLLSKYPWLTPYNVWTGRLSEDYNYSYTWLDDMPEGWRIAFGMEMCEEIQQALIKLPKPYFFIHQIKEKYGTLRFYCGGATEEIHSIISKYEAMSWHYCIDCGKPAKWKSLGWISPWCDECKDRMEERDIHDTFVPIEEDEDELDEEV